MPTRLILVRHGATAINLQRPYRLQGRVLDPDLADLGRRQSQAACEALRHLSVNAVYASPLKRAMQSARIVAEPHRVQVQPQPALAEADVGQWEGLTWEEAKGRDPDAYERFMADPGSHPYAGGECMQDVLDRVSPGFRRLMAQHPQQTIVVVAHNGVNRTYCCHLLGLPLSRVRGIPQANGAVNVIESDGTDVSLVTLNSTLHLEGITGEG